MLLFALALLQDPSPDLGPVQAVRACKLFLASGEGVINNGYLAWQDGAITAVGRAGEVGEVVVQAAEDLGDLWIVPGLLEPHCHVAGSLRDLNDMVWLANPELRTLEVVEPGNPMLKDALAGGVTTALLIPGSGTNMGGWGTLLKTSGDTTESMVVRSPGSLKIAQAGNPERWGFRVGRAMMNWNTRHVLERGLGWARDWKAGKAEFQPMMADFVGLLERKIPPSVHTQIYQVVLMTITMQARDLGLASFIDHGTFDGFKTGSLAAQYGVPVMNGPRQFWFDRSRAKIFGTTAEWSKSVPDGLILGYNTDSPGIPQEELTYQAAMGVRLGHDDPAAALEGITSKAAQAMLVSEVSGSLRPGMDADFVAWSGFPLDPRSHVLRAWVRGELVYDAARDGRRF